MDFAAWSLLLPTSLICRYDDFDKRNQDVKTHINASLELWQSWILTGSGFVLQQFVSWRCCLNRPTFSCESPSSDRKSASSSSPWSELLKLWRLSAVSMCDELVEDDCLASNMVHRTILPVLVWVFLLYLQHSYHKLKTFKSSDSLQGCFSVSKLTKRWCTDVPRSLACIF